MSNDSALDELNKAFEKPMVFAFKDGKSVEIDPNFKPTRATTYYQDADGDLCESTMNLETGEVVNKKITDIKNPNRWDEIAKAFGMPIDK